MAARGDGSEVGAAHALDSGEAQDVLSGAFYEPPVAAAISRGGHAKAAREDRAAKPTHYKVICISMYTKDLARLDELVDELKSRGITKANRSALIRVALEQLDLDKVPRGL